MSMFAYGRGVRTYGASQAAGAWSSLDPPALSSPLMRDAVFTQSGIKSPTATTDDAMASQVSAELSPVSK